MHCRARACVRARTGWALAVAMSRAFGFSRLDGWALVPLVDMVSGGTHVAARIASLCCVPELCRLQAARIAGFTRRPRLPARPTTPP